jgi:hypothetical protein
MSTTNFFIFWFDFGLPIQYSMFTMNKVFRLYWLGGKTEIVTGKTIAEAFTKAGYSAGALAALDYYETL